MTASSARLRHLAFVLIGGDDHLRPGQAYPDNTTPTDPPEQDLTRDIHLARHRSRRSDAFAL